MLKIGFLAVVDFCWVLEIWVIWGCFELVLIVCCGFVSGFCLLWMNWVSWVSDQLFGVF